MARPKGTNIVNELINASPTIDENTENKTGENAENKTDKNAENKTDEEEQNKKFKKLLVFDNDMKGILEKEAKERRMTVAGFIKFCIVQEIDKKKNDKNNE